MAVRVSDVMRKGVDTIEEATSIQETAMKMRDKNVSSLLVVDKDGKPIGLVRTSCRKVCVNDIRLL